MTPPGKNRSLDVEGICGPSKPSWPPRVQHAYSTAVFAQESLRNNRLIHHYRRPAALTAVIVMPPKLRGQGLRGDAGPAAGGNQATPASATIPPQPRLAVECASSPQAQERQKLRSA